MDQLFGLQHRRNPTRRSFIKERLGIKTQACLVYFL